MLNRINSVNIRPFPFVRVFLIVYILFNIVGIINFPIYNRIIKENYTVYLFFIGLTGFILGVVSFRKLNFNILKTDLKEKKTNLIKIWLLVICLTCFGLIFLTNLLSGGIIILSGDKRFTSFAFTNLFVFASIIISLTYFANKLLNNRKISFFDFSFLLIQALFFLSLGYRSPLISLLGGFYIVFYSIRNDFQERFKRIFSWKILIGGMGFLILMSYIASFRVSLKYDLDRYYRNIDKKVLKENSYLTPLVPVIALFRYDQEVVDKLVQVTKDDPMYLGLAFSNIVTVLPGDQLGARNIVGKIIGARETPEGKPWSTTPTLQGAFFVDGGYAFVFVGFFFTAFFMEYLRKLILCKRDPFLFSLYGLVVVATLKCIHTGYLDVSFYIIIFVLFVLRFLVLNINYSNLGKTK